MNYLSHLVGRTLRLNQPLEPVRGNPFEPVQAREPEEVSTPEERITQRLRPVRTDAPAPAVVPAAPSRDAPALAPAPLVATLDAVLAQAPASHPELPESERSSISPPKQASTSSVPHARADGAAARGPEEPVSQDDEVGTPAAVWAQASANLRRSAERMPLLPARKESAEITSEDAPAPRLRAALIEPAQVTRRRERTGAAMHPAESPIEPVKSQAVDGAPPTPPTNIRRAPPLLPVTRALPPPAIAAAPAAPDVHITIGSVEIRANAAPSPAKPVARAPRALRPSMNLADYLQKRRGGR